MVKFAIRIARIVLAEITAKAIIASLAAYGAVTDRLPPPPGDEPVTDDATTAQHCPVCYAHFGTDPCTDANPCCVHDTWPYTPTFP